MVLLIKESLSFNSRKYFVITSAQELFLTWCLGEIKPGQSTLVTAVKS